MTLTPSQSDALTKLSQWWKSSTQHIIISGSPGTGKTFLVQHFINALPDAVPLFTATTNEAVRQLELVLEDKNVCKTTYSALGLKLGTRARKQYIYCNGTPKDFSEFNLMVIDESSMVGEGEKKKELLDYVLETRIKCVWLGDWAQLPPIGREDGNSPVFNKPWENLKLTQVKRHKEDILNFAMLLRKVINNPVRNIPEIPDSINTLKLGSDTNLNLSNDILDSIVDDEAKILVWTNSSTKYNTRVGVKQYNEYVRKYKFGDAAIKQHILPTDKILFASPLIKFNPDELRLPLDCENIEGVIEASVNTKAEVIKVTSTKLMGFDVWETEVELEHGGNTICYIPTEVGHIQLSKYQKELRRIISVAYKKNPETNSKLCEIEKVKRIGDMWHFYHTFNSLFADVKHTYCMTGHRAQGSTIPNVYVDVKNVLQNRNRKEAFKNLYVCCTRARDSLTLIL